MGKRNDFIKLILIASFIPFNALAFYNGIIIHPQSTSLNAVQLLNEVNKYEFNSIRVDYPWSDVEKEKGKYKKIGGNLDEVLSNSFSEGLRSIIILDYGNKIYNISEPEGIQQINEFDGYAKWVVNNFSQYNPIFEIWNEWGQKNKKIYNEMENSANKYFEVVKKTSQTIKSNNKANVVIAGSFNPTNEEQLKWFEKLIDKGILRYIDGVSVHPYAYSYKSIMSVNDNFKAIDDLESYIKKKNNGKIVPIYITEIGLPSYDGVKFTQKDIANYRKKYYQEAKGRSYIKGVWWYELIDAGYNKKNTQDNYGMLTKDLKEKEVAKMILEDSNNGK